MSARVSYLTQRTSAAHTTFAMGDIADIIRRFDDFADYVTGRLDALEQAINVSSVKASSGSAQAAQSNDQNQQEI